jgi:glycosyltransferase involved in cell wall biosynthesis
MKSLNSEQFIFLIDSRGIITSKNPETFDRHLNYAKRLKESSPNSHLYIISAVSDAQARLHSGDLIQEFIKSNKRVSLKYIIDSISVIKSVNSNHVVLVAGDPWEAGLNSRIIRYLLRSNIGRRIPIQMQVHADITDDNWKKRSLINLFRVKFGRINLKSADQIRAVSNSSSQEIISKFKIDSKKVIVLPVVLNIEDEINPIYLADRPRSIGFAGRFHADRGLEDFILYVTKLSSLDPEISIVLAGEGPDLKKFLSRLQTLVPPNRVEYLGHLQKDEMQTFWSKVGVYVSTAKSESYGRSIRESAFFGIPVLGVKSGGFTELKAVNVNWIEELNIHEDAEFLVEQVSRLMKSTTTDSVRELLTSESRSNAGILVDSWLRLMPKSNF